MLSNQIALVTGASRGIGRAVATELARQGAIVVGTATTDRGAEAISNYLSEANARGRGAVLDVKEADQVSALLKGMADAEGAPGILVNNAGITRDDLLMRMKQDAWDTIIDTNLTSVFRMTKACVRAMMKARHGRIINVTSVVANIGNPGQANYAAAKAGIGGFTRSIASELASRNITVNSVAPGFIETDMTKDLDDAQREQLLSHIPLGRMGSPEDVAGAVAFLASPAANYITGSTLHVNGGMYMPA